MQTPQAKGGKKDGAKVVRFSIRLKTTFKFAHWANAQNVTSALSLAGYFVNMKERDGFYEVNVYEYDTKE